MLENQIKIDKIKIDVTQFFTELDSIFSDKKGFKEKMKTNLACNQEEDLKELVGDCKPVQDAQFNLEKWKEMADILKETEPNVLTNKKDSKYVPSSSIKTKMLEGAGQIVEVVKKDDKTR